MILDIIKYKCNISSVFNVLFKVFLNDIFFFKNSFGKITFSISHKKKTLQMIFNITSYSWD